MHIYKKKTIIFLMILLVLFALITMSSLFNLKRGVSIINLGMGARNENIVLIILSFLGAVWALVEIVQVEHRR